MAENQKKELTVEELKNNLQAAINQLRVLDQRNKDLTNQNQAYQMTDYYQRASWLWTIIKEGKDVGLPEEFIDKTRKDFVDMFTVVESEENDNDNN